MINYADVIVDLQHGDSGKGKIANYLARSKEYTHVVRYNGGNNAGHTIYNDGKKLTTHSVPVGVIHGVKSIIGSGCVVNVNHFFEELDYLEDQEIKIEGLVYISKNTHVITDIHLEEDGKDTKIGTTRRGIGPAYRDKYDRRGLRASEVAEFEHYLIDIYEEFNGDNECKILFEGAQGFYLDVDWGDYPYVTSSHCTVGSAIMNGVPPQKIRKIFGIAKIYETYVGAKTFEPNQPIFSRIRELGQEYGATTGRPRQCNWLNIDALIKATKVNGVTDLVINKVDILRRLNEWCAYDNQKLIKFSNEDEMQEYLMNRLQVESIYWGDSPDGMGKILT